MSKYSDRMRKDFAAGDMVRDAGLTTPDDIVRYDDISYGPDERLNLLDVYRPKDAVSAGVAGGKVRKLPVIAIVHGGAWVYGDKGVYQYYAMSLAQRGFAVVNFSYRLAPENKFPAQLEDICTVFRWMDEHHEKYGLDINNVFAVGDSAGGHLLGLFAALVSDPEYVKALRDKYPVADFSLPVDECGEQSVKLNAVALNFGKYDLTKGDEMDKDTPLILADFLNEGGSEKELALTDVTRHVTSDYPAVFIMTCPGDFLKYQAPFMISALMENSVPFTFKFYGDKKDPLHHVFHCNMRLESAKICNDDECEFFRKHVVM
ncbi:MAG: alpha/beta hydrolase [Lachnospiraceae bacterium]|nr:alpha/beta hydrolase [Lachnospiraceae bacterium]